MESEPVHLFNDQPSFQHAIESYRQGARDLEHENPYRFFGLLTKGGDVETLALVIHHILADGRALASIRQHLSAAAEASSSLPVPTPQLQPLDIARRETEGRQVDSALKHLSEVYDEAPPTLFPFVSRQQLLAGEMNECALYSTGLAADVNELAGRWRLGHNAVLLGAYVMVLAALTQQPVIAITDHHENRDQSTARSVACLFIPTAATIRVDASTHLREAATRAANSFLRSMRHGNYPFAQSKSTICQASYRRGQSFRLTTDYNYLAFQMPADLGQSPDRIKSDSLGWWHNDHEMGLRISFSEGIFCLRLIGNSAVLDRTELRQCVQALRDLVRSAALNDLLPVHQLPLGAVQSARGRVLSEVGGARLDLGAIQRRIDRHGLAGGVGADLSATPRGLELSVALGAVERRHLARDLRDIAAANSWFIAPTLTPSAADHRIVDPTPVSPTYAAANQEPARLAETLRLVKPYVRNGEADQNRPFLIQGGDPLAIPLLLQEARQQDLQGLTEHHLTGLYSLRAIAQLFDIPQRSVTSDVDDH